MNQKQQKIGRPSKYSKEIVEEICKYIREGSTCRDACALAGIHHSTFYKWMEEFSDFSDAIARSDAEAARERIQRIRAAGVRVRLKNGKNVVEGDWKADAWWLERRRRDEYNLKANFYSHPEQGVENALKLVDALLEGTKTGRRKTTK